MPIETHFPEAINGAKHIYLDTNLWNELCDQRVPVERLIEALGTSRAAHQPALAASRLTP